MNYVYPAITPENKRCVYKMYFEDGSFYIGSTHNLRERIANYKRSFKGSIGNVNKLIAAKSETYLIIWFEILEVVPANDPTRPYEDKWLKKAIGNPLLLNRSKSAFNNSGMIKAR